MSNITEITDGLRREREKIDRALQALEGSQDVAKKKPAVSTGKRFMSQDARDRIAAAQRERWRRVKAQQRRAA